MTLTFLQCRLVSFYAQKESTQDLIPCTHPQGDDYKAETVRCKINASKSPNGSLPEQQVGHNDMHYICLGATGKPWSPVMLYALCFLVVVVKSFY